MTEGARPAVFVDRDGTLVEDPGYLHRPEDVRLLSGAAAAVARLNQAGYLVVIITNQSGIARGLYDETAYDAVQGRLAELLAARGARFDGAHHCPHHPSVGGPCACRKPGTRLYEDAAAALGIDFRRSWLVGDKMSDVEAAAALGGRALLVETGEGRRHAASARALGIPVVADLAAAADGILASAALRP